VDNPTAFVSYAQSSRRWQERVLLFTKVLRVSGGVDAELDLFHGSDHRQWTTFGSELIETCDFTLIAIDAAYKRRWLGKEKTGVGAGVGREAAAIRAIFDRDQDEFVRRVKIVLLPGTSKRDIPDDLLGVCEWFKVPTFDRAGLEQLLRSILGKPEFLKPPLGDIPELPPRAIENLQRDASAGAPDVHEPEATLRNRLSRVKAALKRGGGSSAKPRSYPAASSGTDELRRERDALEVSLDALEQTHAKGLRSEGGNAKRHRQRLRWAVWGSLGRTARALLVTGALIVAGLALGLGAVASDAPEPERIEGVASGGLKLQRPADWSSRDDVAVPGLGIAKPINLEQTSDPVGGRLSISAGLSTAAGRTLLSRTYRRQLDDRIRRAAVSLGSLQAYRYTGLATPGAGAPLAVFVAPTSRGVATLACRMPPSEAGLAFQLCARVASTMRLRTGRAYRLGPSASLVKALRKRLPRLVERRATARQKLDGGADADEQAAAAVDLADAFRDSARSLASVRVSPESAPALAAVLDALRHTRDSYKELAVAARQEDTAEYGLVATAVERAERAVNVRLRALRELGYRVSGSASISQ